MAPPTFSYSHRVTYADCTLGNHVYYARYLNLLEAARGAFFRELGLSFITLQERGIIFPVIECRLRYKTPARYDDVITIAVRPTAAEKIRLNIGYHITNVAGKTILEGETQHVCTNLSDKPMRLPEDLLNKLQPYLPAADS